MPHPTGRATRLVTPPQREPRAASGGAPEPDAEDDRRHGRDQGQATGQKKGREGKHLAKGESGWQVTFAGHLRSPGTLPQKRRFDTRLHLFGQLPRLVSDTLTPGVSDTCKPRSWKENEVLRHYLVLPQIEEA
jgi:hypothetical protein